jgi:predicted Zn-dependent protease with MMP-like domain
VLGSARNLFFRFARFLIRVHPCSSAVSFWVPMTAMTRDFGDLPGFSNFGNSGDFGNLFVTLAACPDDKVGIMPGDTNPESFEQIVEWAYSTLPQKIRRLPDFPGIQVVDEPPPEIFKEMSDREKWRHGTELLGLYSGTLRTKRSFTQLKYAPDLIFVFRGPILRCSKGDLRAEVKQVVWHEVAHWLGFETEEQVEALGL